MTTNKSSAPKYRVGSLIAEGAPVDTFQSALDYAREWVDSEADEVVIIEKRFGAEYMPVRLLYKHDGEVTVRGQKWLERTRAAVMSGAVPWHLALRAPRFVRPA